MDAATLRANLQALAGVDAAAARRLAEVIVPAGVVRAAGHDGIPTFRLASDGSKQRWLGRTAAPAVRAIALLGRFDPGPGNVLLLGVGQGYLLCKLLDSLGPQQAVFVHETDLLELRLVLSLYDFSGALGQRRLVLIGPGEHADLQEALVRAAMANRGHLIPERMLAWPWLSAPELADITGNLARVGERVSAQRASEMARLREEIGAWARCGETREGLLVCSTGTQPEAAAWLEHVAAALAELGVRHATFAPSSPADRHPLALLDLLARLRPERILLLDCHRYDLRDWLPDDLPVTSWLGPDAAISPTAGSGFREGDAWFPTSAQIARCAAEAGVPAGRVAVIPFGVAAEKVMEPAKRALAPSLLVLAEGADCSPRANDVDLDSHAALWKALCAVILETPGSGRRTEAEVILRQAEKRSGVRLAEPGLRQKFLDLTSRKLWPTLRKLRLINRLRRSGAELRLMGNGWGAFPELTGCCVAGSGAGRTFCSAMRGADLLIDLEAGGQVRFRHLLAMSGGCVVLWEAGTEKQACAAWEPYGLGERTPPTWSTEDGLEELVRRLVRSDAARAQLADSFSNHVYRACRMSDRLAVLLGAGPPSRQERTGPCRPERLSIPTVPVSGQNTAG